jgi:replicative DNA helicase
MEQHAQDIEEMIIGSIMVDDEAFQFVKDTLTPDHFYFNINRTIFRHCIKFDKIDLLIVEQSLKDDQLVDVAKKLYGYLEHTSIRYEYGCQVLTEKKILRDAVKGATAIIRAAEDTDPFELIDKVSLYATSLGEATGEVVSLTPSQIRERDKVRPKSEKLIFGSDMLDNGIFADSMKRGQTVLTIADSGHGKTQASLYLAQCLVKRYKVAWFQLEGYDSETAERFESDNIFICDTIYDIEKIKREARRLHKEHGIDYIVIDYVQNVECRQNISKTEKVEYISKEIQKLAKELNCICNPLSQVTIEGSRRGWENEPRYNDVRWSKQLKQDADLMISVFRPSRIEELIENEEYVKDWRGELIPYNSVYMKQVKVRHGQQEWKRIHLLHHEDGLKPYAAVTPNAPF